MDKKKNSPQNIAWSVIVAKQTAQTKKGLLFGHARMKFLGLPKKA